MDELLRVEHLSKSFGAHVVLRDIDFTVKPGDVTSIIGASGSGKSTLLRCINLLETPTAGAIYFHGDNMLARGVNAAAYRTKVGMVFQSFNLFNNMTVLDNCIVGQTKVLGKNKEEARANAMMYLDDINKWPIQVWLRQIIVLSVGGFAGSESLSEFAKVPSDAVKYAVICVSTLPIVVVYPFLQKYFAKGALLGSVKG